MPQQTFRGDPYRVLDVDPDATDATIKRRWRQLARDLHPDRAGGDATKTADLTKRMARVNAAYDLLRDAGRRASYDAGHPNAGAGHSTAAREAGRRGASSERPRPGGPPPPPPTRPVTGRFDTSEQFHRRNATTTKGIPPLRGQLPLSARERAEGPEPLRASHPTGPIRTRRTRVRAPLPTLQEALATCLEFGKFRGHTLGEVAAFEPTYIDWIARTITRDRDLVVRARVSRADLDARGIERHVHRSTPEYSTRRTDTDAV